MSNVIKYNHIVHNNTFLLTTLLHVFYKNYKGQEKDMLLAYLILPLVLNGTTKKNLKRSKTTSSIHSFTRKKENLYGLQKRISEYVELTNKCIQNGIDNRLFVVNKDLKIKVIDEEVLDIPSLKDSIKASSNLVKVLKDLDVISIYRLLGIKTI